MRFSGWDERATRAFCDDESLPPGCRDIVTFREYRCSRGSRRCPRARHHARKHGEIDIQPPTLAVALLARDRLTFLAGAWPEGEDRTLLLPPSLMLAIPKKFSHEQRRRLSRPASI